MTSIIEAQDVHKHYVMGEEEVPALQGITLAIAPGEMVAVMGPSGCGKTTLLNCLSGLDRFDAGTVRIAGQSLARMSDRQRTTYRARQMGFIFQTFNLLAVLSAVENVELPLLVTGTPTGQARQRAREALSQVGLQDRMSHLPAQLSGGQMQRVTIARALVNQPAIVWVDEPTGNLDEDTSEEILELLRDLNLELGQTLVIVTHDSLVSERCDWIVRMQNGRIVPADARAAPATAQDAAADDPETAPA